MKNNSDPGGEIEAWVQSYVTGKRYTEYRYCGDAQPSTRITRCYIEAKPDDELEIRIRVPKSFEFGDWWFLCVAPRGIPAIKKKYISYREIGDARSDIMTVYRETCSKGDTIVVVCERLSEDFYISDEDETEAFVQTLYPPASEDREFDPAWPEGGETVRDMVYQFEFHCISKRQRLKMYDNERSVAASKGTKEQTTTKPAVKRKQAPNQSTEQAPCQGTEKRPETEPAIKPKQASDQITKKKTETELAVRRKQVPDQSTMEQSKTFRAINQVPEQSTEKQPKTFRAINQAPEQSTEKQTKPKPAVKRKKALDQSTEKQTKTKPAVKRKQAPDQGAKQERGKTQRRQDDSSRAAPIRSYISLLSDDEEHETLPIPERPALRDFGYSSDPVGPRNNPEQSAPHDVENMDEEGLKSRLEDIEFEKVRLETHLKKLQEDKRRKQTW